MLRGAFYGLFGSGSYIDSDHPNLDPVRIEVMEPNTFQWALVGTSVPNINAVSVRLREEVRKVPGRRARALDSTGRVIDIA
jgi:hypothetical protein